MSKPYKVLLFDMDGTLADTDLMIVATFIDMFRKFRPDFPITLKEIVYFSGPPILETLEHYFPDHEIDFIWGEYMKISRAYYKDYIRNFPGAHDAINHLKLAGYRLGIITSKVYDATIESLELLGFDPNMFEVIIGADNVKHAKPNAEPMQKALEYLKVKPADVLYVGDNGLDYVFAVNSGVDSALVSWTLRALDPKLTPTYIFNSYAELEEELL